MANPVRRPDGRISLRAKLLVLVLVAMVIAAPAAVVVVPVLRALRDWLP
ncbi:MAG TPA: hypothetical protein VEZ46_04790 [Mycobacteriales bacterium]|nr:hypothetical protein [Mycobacteriales bacterium]